MASRIKKGIVIGSILLSSFIYGDLANVPFSIAKGNINFRNGDIIVQTSISSQSKYIQKITESNYSHTGLIEKIGNDYWVIEAVNPVKKTQIDDWIKRGKNNKYSVYRFKNLTENQENAVVSEAEKFLGRPYDVLFEPSDSKVYCSELVYKAFQRGIGVEVGTKEDLSDLIDKSVNKIPELKSLVNLRFGEKIPDYSVITPSSIIKSDKLEKIYSNY
jgi:uncharacterized protein YycO